MVKIEAECDARCCESNRMNTRTSQRVLRNRRRCPRPRSGEEAYIEIKPAAPGERSGSPELWLCRRQGHTHASYRYRVFAEDEQQTWLPCWAVAS